MAKFGPLFSLLLNLGSFLIIAQSFSPLLVLAVAVVVVVVVVVICRRVFCNFAI